MSRGPFSANGVGWTYYGQRDFGPDGSFITTEWFIIFYFPVFPLRSYRAISHGTENVVGFFYERESFSVSKRMSPDLRQVGCIYAYAIALAGFVTYVSLNFKVLVERFSTWGGIGGLLICGLCFLLVPGFLRRRAIRRAGLRIVRRRRR